MVSPAPAKTHDFGVNFSSRPFILYVTVEPLPSQLEKTNVALGGGDGVLEVVLASHQVGCFRKVRTGVTLVYTDQGTIQALTCGQIRGGNRTLVQGGVYITFLKVMLRYTQIVKLDLALGLLLYTTKQILQETEV